MNIQNFLSSGLSFDQYDPLKYKYQLFNSLLGFNAIIILSAALFRLMHQQYFQMGVDLAYSLLAIVMVILTRRDPKHFDLYVKIVMFYSMIVVTLMFYTAPVSVTGVSWFLIQMMVVSFLTDKKYVIINLVMTVAVIVMVTRSKPEIMITSDVLIAMIPIAVSMFFLIFYEKRNRFMMQQLEDKNAQLDEYAKRLERIDYLTGLPNQVAFKNYLKEVIENQDKRSKFGLLQIDLDHFKQINESDGHEVGDELLIHVTERLKKVCASSKMIARVSADEFVVVCDESMLDVINNNANSILKEISEIITLPQKEYHLTASIGVAFYPQDGDTEIEIVKSVETALHRAKENGRNRVEFYDQQLTEVLEEKLKTLKGIKESIAESNFYVVYQPQVDTATGRIVGMEALVRWNHPELGITPPVKFIPIAEEFGLVKEIDLLVMQEALQQFSTWIKQGYEVGKLSLNISMGYFESRDYFNRFIAMIHSVDLDAKYVEVEITEGSIMVNPHDAIHTMEMIKSLGISIAVDDFGTGYSSLSYLKKLPIDKLKIDRSFIVDLLDDQGSEEIVKTIITLANKLNLNLIAEGVETQQQQEFLTKNGCTITQGYLYYKPLNANELEKVLAANS
jgi:diguanylate cyclase (GGDEF)-like protein